MLPENGPDIMVFPPLVSLIAPLCVLTPKWLLAPGVLLSAGWLAFAGERAFRCVGTNAGDARR